MGRGGFVVEVTLDTGGVSRSYALQEAVNGSRYDGWDDTCSGPGHYRQVRRIPLVCWCWV